MSEDQAIALPLRVDEKDLTVVRDAAGDQFADTFIWPRSMEVSEAYAAHITLACNAFRAMKAALEKIDADWTAEFPDGPDGSREWCGGLGRLSDSSVETWREIRAALSLANGRE